MQEAHDNALMEKSVVMMNGKLEAEHMKELYCQILGLIWKINPIYLAYFVYFAPRLLKTVCFFTPLLVSTCLLVLVIFSLGPQLERIRVEGDLQWKRFREASGILGLRAEDDRRIRQPTRCCRGWLHDVSGLCSVGIEVEQELGVGFEECGSSVIAMAEDDTLNPCQSIVVNKVKVLMDRLVAELGGKVDFGVPYAIEAVAEAFMETTLRQYEEDIVNSSIGTAGDGESRDGLEAKTLRDCALVGLESVCFEAKSVGELPLIAKCKSMDSHDFSQMSDFEDSEEQIDELDKPACEVGDVQANVFETPVGSSEELYAAKLPDLSQLSKKDNRVVDNGNEADSSHVLHGLEQCVFKSCRSFPFGDSEEEFPTMDRLWEEDHNNLGLFAAQKNQSAKKEKNWKKTLAGKLYEEQHNLWKGSLAGKLLEDHATGSSKFYSQLSPSMKIPEHLNYEDILSGKSTSSSSESLALTSAGSSLNDEEMDQLWEEYNDAPCQETEAPIKGLSKGLAKLQRLRQNVDSDAEDGPEDPQLCCLRAFRFSMGKMPLRRPNFTKFSKALKNFGLIQHIRGQKQ